jgi:hypothetical protein
MIWATRYESNDKHKKPWQRGKRGSLCPASIDTAAAQRLLRGSVPHSTKRYASDGARPFCAQEHQPGRWHGYPVGWEEVPPKVRAELISKHGVTRRSIKQYWRREPGR